jgi:hypothetical protein
MLREKEIKGFSGWLMLFLLLTLGILSIVMLIRSPAPIKFFDTPKSACLWVGTQLPAAKDGLVEEIEALRGLLDNH